MSDERLAVADYVTRANYGLVIGNFEMDFSDGEVRYKTSVDVEGGELTSSVVTTDTQFWIYRMAGGCSSFLH